MPSFREAKTEISLVVSKHRGLKFTQLSSLLSSEVLILDIKTAVQEMVLAGELVVVEYILPNTNHSVQSFLLPAETKLCLIENKQPTD